MAAYAWMDGWTGGLSKDEYDNVLVEGEANFCDNSEYCSSTNQNDPCSFQCTLYAHTYRW